MASLPGGLCLCARFLHIQRNAWDWDLACNVHYTHRHRYIIRFSTTALRHSVCAHRGHTICLYNYECIFLNFKICLIYVQTIIARSFAVCWEVGGVLLQQCPRPLSSIIIIIIWPHSTQNLVRTSWGNLINMFGHILQVIFVIWEVAHNSCVHGWLKWTGLAWSKINYTRRRTRAGCWSWFFTMRHPESLRKTRACLDEQRRRRQPPQQPDSVRLTIFPSISIIWLYECATVKPVFSRIYGLTLWNHYFRWV